MAIDVVDGNSLFGDDDVVAWIDLKIGTELIIKMSSERAKQELKILGRELVYKLFLSKGSLNQYNAKTMF